MDRITSFRIRINENPGRLKITILPPINSFITPVCFLVVLGLGGHIYSLTDDLLKTFPSGWNPTELAWLNNSGWILINILIFLIIVSLIIFVYFRVETVCLTPDQLSYSKGLLGIRSKKTLPLKEIKSIEVYLTGKWGWRESLYIESENHFLSFGVRLKEHEAETVANVLNQFKDRWNR